MTLGSEFGLKIDIFGGFDWLKVYIYDQYQQLDAKRKDLTPPFCTNRIKQIAYSFAGQPVRPNFESNFVNSPIASPSATSPGRLGSWWSGVGI